MIKAVASLFVCGKHKHNNTDLEERQLVSMEDPDYVFSEPEFRPGCGVSGCIKSAAYVRQIVVELEA